MTFEAQWTRCGPWIQAALDHAANTHGLHHIEAMIQAGDAHFWPGREAAMITQIVTHPNFKALHFWLAGGALAELVDELRPTAESWARETHGVTRSTILGRPGWEKTLAPYGYAASSRLLVKELT